jgi:hypothetical protein
MIFGGSFFAAEEAEAEAGVGGGFALGTAMARGSGSPAAFFRTFAAFRNLRAKLAPEATNQYAVLLCSHANVVRKPCRVPVLVVGGAGGEAEPAGIVVDVDEEDDVVEAVNETLLLLKEKKKYFLQLG